MTERWNYKLLNFSWKVWKILLYLQIQNPLPPLITFTWDTNSDLIIKDQTIATEVEKRNNNDWTVDYITWDETKP